MKLEEETNTNEMDLQVGGSGEMPGDETNTNEMEPLVGGASYSGPKKKDINTSEPMTLLEAALEKVPGFAGNKTACMYAIQGGRVAVDGEVVTDPDKMVQESANITTIRPSFSQEEMDELKGPYYNNIHEFGGGGTKQKKMIKKKKKSTKKKKSRKNKSMKKKSMKKKSMKKKKSLKKKKSKGRKRK